MSDEVTDFLLDPKRLVLALEIASRRDALATRVVNEYWVNVARSLGERLAHAGSGGWLLDGPGRAEAKHSTLAFRLSERGGPEESDTYLGYGVGYCPLTSDPEDMYIGVWRGKPLPPGAHAVQAVEAQITERLKSLGIDKADEDFLGWQRTHRLGVTAARITDDDFLVRLNEDNRDSGHPLAARAAEALWETFTATRPLLEQAFEKLLAASGTADPAPRRSRARTD